MELWIRSQDKTRLIKINSLKYVEYNDVSRYDYEFVFRPEAIIPVEIKTQVGEN